MLSVRRLSRCLQAPPATVGRWVKSPAGAPAPPTSRRRPVSGDPALVKKVKKLCKKKRYQRYGYRRVRAQLRKDYGLCIGQKTVRRIMRDEGLAQPKLRFKPARPPHIGKMVAEAPNTAWQIDMTCFVLADLTPLYLIVVIDCFSRKVVGWNLDRRCRAKEWIAAVRLALEAQGLTDGTGITLRCDNGSQPCSKRFVEYLSSAKIRGEYTGYNAPDDNAFVERVIRTIKEEEIWPNLYDSWSEAHRMIEEYIAFYNHDRIHSALDYKTPKEIEDETFTLKAA
jgi:putative transposase